MKTIILAGGLGTRISEETENKPKPMVLIDENPIIWHLMNIYAQQGFSEFAIALGYRGDVIKRWLRDLHELAGSISVEISSGEVNRLDVIGSHLNWKVMAIETGSETQTGGRIKQCMQRFPGERVMVTYGDGLGNVNLNKLLEFHKSQNRLATVTAVRPPARFGHMEIKNSTVSHFGEKNQMDAGWINGGFFVLEPEVIDYIESNEEPFETGALARLVKMGQLSAYCHNGFWQPMDTLREKNELTKLAKSSNRVWLNIQD